MILEVDIGNSRIKWRLRSGNAVMLSSVSNYGHDLDSIFNLSGIEPTTVRVSTVRPSIHQLFSQWSHRRFGVKAEYALVNRKRAGVTNGYTIPSQMGVDRWLAILAGFQLVKRSFVVVDCGTACTIDVVADSGQHIGGYIVPGLKMMSDTLGRNTEGVKLSATDYMVPPAPGKSTNAAVAAGLSAMIIGLIEYTLTDSSLKGNNISSLLLTGGDGEQFQRVLADRSHLKVEFDAELVLDGLRYATFINMT